MRAHLAWTVWVGENTRLETTIPDEEYQSEDHIWETVAESVRVRGYNPDDVEDWEERE